MKNLTNTIIIGLTIVITTLIVVFAFNKRITRSEIISVTGLGKKDFASDLIVWSGAFSKKSLDLQKAYKELNTDNTSIKEYLIKMGADEKEIVFSAIDIDQEYDYYYDKFDNSHEKFTGYRLTQIVTIESKDVDKIEDISRQVTELINLGIEFYSDPPQYYYTRLAELKLEMIASATEDARLRAEKIAINSGSKIGKLKIAKMGVFQIIARNSNEDYSWGGSYNTRSKMKTATITMKLEFGIK